MPPLAKGHDMRQRPNQPGAGLSLTTAGRRRSPLTKTLVIWWEIVLITSLTAALTSADSHTTQLEKGHNPMQQAVMVSVKDVPPLDRSLPSRVETFTFGLG